MISSRETGDQIYQIIDKLSEKHGAESWEFELYATCVASVMIANVEDYNAELSLFVLDYTSDGHVLQYYEIPQNTYNKEVLGYKVDFYQNVAKFERLSTRTDGYESINTIAIVRWVKKGEMNG
jgi:hypothetical protein